MVWWQIWLRLYVYSFRSIWTFPSCQILISKPKHFAAFEPTHEAQSQFLEHRIQAEEGEVGKPNSKVWNGNQRMRFCIFCRVYQRFFWKVESGVLYGFMMKLPDVEWDIPLNCHWGSLRYTENLPTYHVYHVYIITTGCAGDVMMAESHQIGDLRVKLPISPFGMGLQWCC